MRQVALNLIDVCAVIKETQPTNVFRLARRLNETELRVRYAVKRARRLGFIRTLPHTYKLVIVLCGEQDA